MSSATDAPVVSDAARGKSIAVERVSVLDTLTPHIFQTLLREPALAITLGYLFVAMAGIFYNYTFYKRFGIPVLTLSQVGDFLVAGVQQPMAILLALSTFPLVWLADKLNLRRRRRRFVQREALLASGRNSFWIRLRLMSLLSPPPWLTALVSGFVIFGYGWVFVLRRASRRCGQKRRGSRGRHLAERTKPAISVAVEGLAISRRGVELHLRLRSRCRARRNPAGEQRRPDRTHAGRQ
jgi:hypothetical protein